MIILLWLPSAWRTPVELFVMWCARLWPIRKHDVIICYYIYYFSILNWSLTQFSTKFQNLCAYFYPPSKSLVTKSVDIIFWVLNVMSCKLDLDNGTQAHSQKRFSDYAISFSPTLEKSRYQIIQTLIHSRLRSFSSCYFSARLLITLSKIHDNASEPNRIENKR